MTKAASLLLVLVLLAPCALAQGGPFDPFGLPAPRAWREAIEAGTRTATGEPGPRYWTDDIGYRIEVALDPVAARVSGRAEMTYRNGSPDELRDLWVHLRQNLHKAGARRTREVEVTGGFELESVRVGGEAARARIDGTLMRIRLPEALAPGAEVVVEIAWSFRVPRAGRAPRMGHEDEEVFFLAYWYPQFAVREDVRGWVAEQYLGNGEFYMNFADYDVAITAPAGYLVRATGELTNPEEVLTDAAIARLAEAMETDAVVRVVDEDTLAAGGLTRRPESGSLTWRFRAADVRDVCFSAARNYVWDAARARVRGEPGAEDAAYALVEAVYEPDAPAIWKRAVDYARHTVEWGSTNLFPYPWPHLTVCEGIIGGSGMEFPMVTLIGGAPRSPAGLQGIISHEIVHMWFPMIVGQNEKRWSWMDEGLTSFVEDFESAAFHGRTVNPAGVAQAYRSFERRVEGETSMTHADRFGADLTPYQLVTYSKPAAALHQLRMILGDEPFWRAMRTYVERWAFKHPWPQDLAATFREVTGTDLDWYFRTWFFESWTLDQAIAGITHEDGASKVAVRNLGDAIGPTTLEIRFADGAVERVAIPVARWMTGENPVVLPFDRRVASARIDPDGWTLDVRPDNDGIE